MPKLKEKYLLMLKLYKDFLTDTEKREDVVPQKRYLVQRRMLDEIQKIAAEVGIADISSEQEYVRRQLEIANKELKKLGIVM